MAKNPPLTKEQKQKISQYKDSSKKPTEICRETGIPITQCKQIGGFLHFLRRPSIFNPGPKPKQTQAKPEQTKENQPSPDNPKNTQDGPKNKEVGTVAIDQNDLNKIQTMINDTTTAVQQKTIEMTKEASQEAVTHALTNFKEAERKEKERQATEAKNIEIQAQVNTFCTQFPDLCKRMDALEKKVPNQPKDIEKEIHSSAKEYLECQECGPSLIRAMAKMTKTNPDFAGKIQETLKEQGVTLTVSKEEKPKDETSSAEEESTAGPF